MPSAIAALNGTGPQEVYLYLGYVSYDISGNYSTWYWELVYKQNGGIQWASDPIHYWQLSGFAAAGPNYFGIPSSWAGGGDFLLGNGYFTKPHDSEGYLIINDNFYGSIVTGVSNIGSGTAVINSGISAPRIPKVPNAPTSLPVDQITADSMRYRFNDGDLRGGTVQSRAIQYATTSNFASGTRSAIIGVGSDRTFILTDAQPGTDYYFRSRVQTEAGVSAWSNVVSGSTLAGVFVSDGVNWVAQPVRISDGVDTWENEMVSVSTGTVWEVPNV